MGWWTSVEKRTSTQKVRLNPYTTDSKLSMGWPRGKATREVRTEAFLPTPVPAHKNGVNKKSIELNTQPHCTDITINESVSLPKASITPITFGASRRGLCSCPVFTTPPAREPSHHARRREQRHSAQKGAVGAPPHRPVIIGLFTENVKIPCRLCDWGRRARARGEIEG